ncbi:MAG: DNA polymerase III subunit beta [Bacteroidetes bacterium]|nr:MAG: DNA polymerase III subunit beta [Bacteroidota bacterium]
MKFIVSSGVLHKQLSSISGVIVNNPIVPILENFLFVVKNSVLTASASDLQISMTTSVDVECQEDMSIAIPAKKLMDTLKGLPDQPITMNINPDDFSIEITSYKGRYKLAGEDANDFPKIAQPDGKTKVTLSSELLGAAIGRTLFATGTDELRPAMTGILMKLEKNQVTFVSTDGNRLIRYTRKDVEADVEQSVIIPKKAFALLRSALPSSNVDVVASFSGSNAFFAFEETSMVCRLIDERYPDYELVIPANNDKKLEVKRMELISSLKRLDVYANQSTHQVRLKVGGPTLQMFAEDLDFSNEATESILAEFEGEEELEIGFNVRFMNEMLNNVTTDTVIFTFSMPSRASVILPETQEEGEDMLMLLMPMLLNNNY